VKYWPQLANISELSGVLVIGIERSALEIEESVEANLAICRDSRAVDDFRQAITWGLTVPETYCLNLVPPSHRRSVIDIGIGAGRTTGPLSKMFKQYAGIDYSPEMVQAAKVEFPGADLRVMDVRQLALEQSADCIMFSFNGIDCIPYEDRQAVLARVKKQLVPGGYYIYSTHNLRQRRADAWLNHFWVKELFRKRLYTSVPLVLNRLKHFREQSNDAMLGFAYVNDPAQRFDLLQVYVDIVKECEVLRRHGFSVCATIGNNKHAEGYDVNDNWVYIVAKRG
jgi:SAM-dependent methyltransferase